MTSKENFSRLTAYMQEHGYSKDYLRAMKTEIRVVVRLQENGEWPGYREHYLRYAETIASSTYLRRKTSFVGLLEQFDVHGIFPSGPGVFTSFMRDTHYDHLCDEFKCVIDTYRAIEGKRGVKAPTIHVSSLNASAFFHSMQEIGVNSLAQIGEKEVVGFFFFRWRTEIRTLLREEYPRRVQGHPVLL